MFNHVCVVFGPREGRKRHTIKTKYHAAAGNSTLSESPIVNTARLPIAKYRPIRPKGCLLLRKSNDATDYSSARSNANVPDGRSGGRSVAWGQLRHPSGRVRGDHGAIRLR